MKTYKDAIWELRALCESCKTPNECEDCLSNVAIEALRLHTPTKPNWLYDDEPLCPYCQCPLEEYEEVCERCTQIIDWGDTE